MTPMFHQRSLHPNLTICVLSAFLLWTGCKAQPVSVQFDHPVPTISLDETWVKTEAGENHIGVRHENGDGVVVRLTQTPEILLVQGGRPTGVRFTPTSNELTAITIKQDGPDLLVRLAGPPINTITDHKEAPEDPALRGCVFALGQLGGASFWMAWARCTFQKGPFHLSPKGFGCPRTAPTMTSRQTPRHTPVG